MSGISAIWVTALAILSCCAAPQRGAERPTATDGERAAVMNVDRAFDRATAERGVDGWVSFFADSGVQFPRVGVLVGKDAIRQFMAPVFADTGTALRWHPTSAVVAASGDLAYTIGRWEFSNDSAGRSSVTGRGNYVTIWRKVPDGSWKVAVDIGNNDPTDGPPPR